MKWLKLFFLQRAIRTIEKAGLAVVQVKRGDKAVYQVGRNGTYVRFDKVKA